MTRQVGGSGNKGMTGSAAVAAAVIFVASFGGLCMVNRNK